MDCPEPHVREEEKGNSVAGQGKGKCKRNGRSGASSKGKKAWTNLVRPSPLSDEAAADTMEKCMWVMASLPAALRLTSVCFILLSRWCAWGMYLTCYSVSTLACVIMDVPFYRVRLHISLKRLGGRGKVSSSFFQYTHTLQPEQLPALSLRTPVGLYCMMLAPGVIIRHCTTSVLWTRRSPLLSGTVSHPTMLQS